MSLADAAEVQTRAQLGVIERTLQEADRKLDDMTRVIYGNVAGYLVEALTEPLGISMDQTTWQFGRGIGHTGASDQLLSLNHLLVTGQLAPGDHVLLAGERRPRCPARSWRYWTSPRGRWREPPYLVRHRQLVRSRPGAGDRAARPRRDRGRHRARSGSVVGPAPALGGAAPWTARLDVTDPERIRQVVDDAAGALGRIDVAISNAGVGLFGAAEEATDEQIDRQIDTNLTGPIHLARALLPHMRAQGGGRIIQISSVGGQATTPAWPSTTPANGAWRASSSHSRPR